MTQEDFNLLPREFSERVIQLLEATAKQIKLTVATQVLKAEFADGQRLLINFNPNTGKIWLAGHSVATEYTLNGEHWLSQQDGSEFFECLSQILDGLSSSSALNALPGKLQIIGQTKASVVTPQRELSSPSNRPAWQYLLVLLPILYLGYQYFSITPKVLSTVAESSKIEIPAEHQADIARTCESSRPENGASEVFAESNGNSSAGVDVKISNEHDYDIVVFFTKPNSATPLSSILVKSKNTVVASMKAGNYELMFSTGKIWCNLQTGFKGGQISKLDNRFEFIRQVPVVISLQSTGPTPAQFQVFMRDQQKKAPEPPAINIVSEGVVELQQSADGHYYIPGTINGAPLLFMIDTGASITTLKRDIALAGGIRDCRAAKLNTANGVVEACIGLISEMRIGPYTINNAEVASNPNIDTNLLGMNVLSQFQINTEKGVMRLSKQ